MTGHNFELFIKALEILNPTDSEYKYNKMSWHVIIFHQRGKYCTIVREIEYTVGNIILECGLVDEHLKTANHR